MRWFWIDRFTKFVSGKCAEAVKNVSLADEVTDEYAPGRPLYPSSMIIEGMAQAGGILLDQMHGFSGRVVLAKVSKAEFMFEAMPGDQLNFRVDIDVIQKGGGGALVKGTVHKGDQLQANIDLMFAILGIDDDRFANVQLFEPADFCRMIRLLRTFQVGVNEDGTPIEVPPHMLEAEKAYLKMEWA